MVQWALGEMTAKHHETSSSDQLVRNTKKRRRQGDDESAGASVEQPTMKKEKQENQQDQQEGREDAERASCTAEDKVTERKDDFRSWPSIHRGVDIGQRRMSTQRPYQQITHTCSLESFER